MAARRRRETKAEQPSRRPSPPRSGGAHGIKSEPVDPRATSHPWLAASDMVRLGWERTLAESSSAMRRSLHELPRPQPRGRSARAKSVWPGLGRTLAFIFSRIHFFVKLCCVIFSVGSPWPSNPLGQLPSPPSRPLTVGTPLTVELSGDAGGVSGAEAWAGPGVCAGAGDGAAAGGARPYRDSGRMPARVHTRSRAQWLLREPSASNDTLRLSSRPSRVL